MSRGCNGSVIWVMVVALVAAVEAPAADIGTAFTYQGNLEKPAGTPVTDTCDFRFGLWDALIGGNEKGTSPQPKPAVSVSGGVFTVDKLDFGAGAIDGDARWLEIEVKCTGDVGFVPLTPRVELTPAPHAVFADQASRAVGTFNVETASTLSCVCEGNGADCSPGQLPCPPLQGECVPAGLGPTAICFPNEVDPGHEHCIEVNPCADNSGMKVVSNGGLRVARPPTGPTGPTRLLFGPTDDCTIGIDASAPGLHLRDPGGVRVRNPDPDCVCETGGRDCSSGQLPCSGPEGECHPADPLVAIDLCFESETGVPFCINIDPCDNDPSMNVVGNGGLRVARPPTAPPGPTRLLFGPTDDCAIGVDPSLPGMWFTDPFGWRFMGPGSLGVGTTTPVEKVDVVGNIKASGTLRSGNSITIDGSTDTITASSGKISFDNETLVTTGRIGIGTTAPSQELHVVGDVQVDGMVNGVTMGKIFLNNSGTILTTRSGGNVLLWDKTNAEIEITNTSGDWCDYWWQAQKAGVTSGGAAAVITGSSNVAIITGTNTNDYGFEVHFGQADGQTGWASVWLQYANGALVGHYIKY